MGRLGGTYVCVYNLLSERDFNFSERACVCPKGAFIKMGSGGGFHAAHFSFLSFSFRFLFSKIVKF